MLGTGLIGDFYTNTLHGQRSRDRVRVVYSRSAERGDGVPRALGRSRKSTTDLAAAVNHPDTDVVVVGAPELPARGGDRAGGRRPARRSCARSRSVGRPRRRAGCSRSSSRPGSSAATSRTSATRPRRSRPIASVAGRGDRRRDLGPLARDPSRAAFGLVLGRPPDRRRRDHRPRLPLHRDHPELRRQGEPAGRGAVPHRHAGPPDRRRGQRGRVHPVRVGGDRPVRGELDVPWRDGPARRGRRHARHDLDEPLPADRVRDVHAPAAAAATSPRRPRRRPAGCSRSATRSPSSATWTCSATCSGRWTRAARRRRRSTTATS